MSLFKISFERIQNGKTISKATTTVEANSISEAKEKFSLNHQSSNSYQYRIIACVKN